MRHVIAAPGNNVLVDRGLGPCFLQQKVLQCSTEGRLLRHTGGLAGVETFYLVVGYLHILDDIPVFILSVNRNYRLPHGAQPATNINAGLLEIVPQLLTEVVRALFLLATFFLSPLPLVRYLEIVLPLRAGPLFSKMC